MIGWGIFKALGGLIKTLKMVNNAENMRDLDAAAKKLAKTLVSLGVDTFIGLLTRGAGKLKRRTNAKRQPIAAPAPPKPKTKKKKKKEEEVEISGKKYKTYSGEGSVYRGDRRNPKEIFEDGFQPKGGTDDLKKYVGDHVDSNFVSTSKSQNLVKGDYYTDGKGYVYEIDSKNLTGIDVNKSIGKHELSFENEVAFHGGIPKEAIINARQVLPSGNLGPRINNPHYIGN